MAWIATHHLYKWMVLATWEKSGSQCSCPQAALICDCQNELNDLELMLKQRRRVCNQSGKNSTHLQVNLSLEILLDKIWNST